MIKWAVPAVAYLPFSLFEYFRYFCVSDAFNSHFMLIYTTPPPLFPPPLFELQRKFREEAFCYFNCWALLVAGRAKRGGIKLFSGSSSHLK